MTFLAFVSKQYKACEIFKGFAPEFESKYGVKFDYVDIEKSSNSRLVNDHRIDTVPSIVCIDGERKAKGILLMSESPNRTTLDEFLQVFA